MRKLTDSQQKSFATNIKQTMKKSDKEKQLREEIINYFNSNSYIIKSDISTLTSKAQPITYICKCKEEKVKTYKDMLIRECRTCRNNKHYEVPTNYSVCPSNNSDEKWAAIEGGFVSNLGNAINFEGKELTLDERGRYYLNGKLQYATILMAKAFNIPGYDKLDGQKSNSIVRNKSDSLKPTLDTIYIGTRNEIGQENGSKSRQSELFKQKMSKDIVKQIEKVPYKKIEELPEHLIFQDGNIYNNSGRRGGNRFLCFSSSVSDTSKSYQSFYVDEKNYKVHKLVCMAFNPLEGKINYDDYEGLQVNHKDGNTLNNHASNLEWSTPSENITHAYKSGLNKKVRAVCQFKNENGKYGELIEEFVSLAEASRNSSVPEYEIREICKGKGNLLNKKYLWKYKNEEENDEWSKKFSSGTLKGSSKQNFNSAENNSSSAISLNDTSCKYSEFEVVFEDEDE